MTGCGSVLARSCRRLSTRLRRSLFVTRPSQSDKSSLLKYVGLSALLRRDSETSAEINALRRDAVLRLEVMGIRPTGDHQRPCQRTGRSCRAILLSLPCDGRAFSAVVV
jgi:hypothetical protein